MNLRISVESVIVRKIKSYPEFLLVKRAPTCKVAPNVWNVPAGKVNLLETTRTAVVRETFEETQLKVKVIQLLEENAFEVQVEDELAYRNMFTYLTEPLVANEDVIINHEHTEFQWVTKSNLEDEKYGNLNPRLKKCILEAYELSGSQY